MNTKISSIILALAIIFIGFIVWGFSSGDTVSQKVSSASEMASALVSSENLYDFGNISMSDGNVEKTFEIKNPTSGDVNVRSVETSCMCTIAYFNDGSGEAGPFGMPGHGGAVALNKIIKAGESAKIRVVYNPNAHGPAGVGRIDRFVYITDSSGKTLQLEIKANVKP